jgi:hypothetical protein
MESNSSFITFLVYDEVACVSSQISPMGNLRLSPQMNHNGINLFLMQYFLAVQTPVCPKF